MLSRPCTICRKHVRPQGPSVEAVHALNQSPHGKVMVYPPPSGFSLMTPNGIKNHTAVPSRPVHKSPALTDLPLTIPNANRVPITRPVFESRTGATDSAASISSKNFRI